MVSVYSLRSVYTFLYTIMNLVASFVQKRKVLRFCGPKFFFLHTYATLKPPSPLKRDRTHLPRPLPSPFVLTYCVDDPLLHQPLLLGFLYFLLFYINFIFVANIRLICDGKTYLLTYILLVHPLAAIFNFCFLL